MRTLSIARASNILYTSVMDLMNLTLLLNDNYVAPRFQTTLAILHMHSVPRFGHTENVTYLFGGVDNLAQKDFLLGGKILDVRVGCPHL